MPCGCAKRRVWLAKKGRAVAQRVRTLLPKRRRNG